MSGGPKITPAMAEHLTYVSKPKPTGVNEHDREPELYVRCVPKGTAAAMLRRGLVEAIYVDFPVGHRGRLTDTGLAARAALLAEADR